MSVYGKLAGALVSVALIGGSAAYVKTLGDEVMADVSEISSQLSQYIIMEYEDKIALFEEGSDSPLAVYSVPIDGINPADYELLKEGIRLRDLSEVARLLEDWDIE